MEDNKILKLVYTFFIGILVAIFVGVGIATFYPAPPAPQWPIELNTLSKQPSVEEEQVQKAYDKKMQAYQEESKPYNQNVSIITLFASVILLSLSIALEKKIKIIADGIMLGGLFTLLYSIGRGFASENTKYVFIAVTIGLAVALYLGYHKFVKTDTKNLKSLKSS
jgi:hypothetical protein